MTDEHIDAIVDKLCECMMRRRSVDSRVVLGISLALVAAIVAFTTVQVNQWNHQNAPEIHETHLQKTEAMQAFWSPRMEMLLVKIETVDKKVDRLLNGK